uniref:Trans-1,2-dihydrobenzene-1,2-diol dehydrogenase n=1 Tax=Ditylenchus dipsaci TaxID=166011 RepID=A0A915D5V4_9BILA
MTDPDHPDGPLRWVILGCGTISSNFVKALSIADRCHQVTCIASTSLEKQRISSTNSICPLSQGIWGLQTGYPRRIDDVVYIGLVASEHKPMAIFAMEHGKHVLCEKPLGLDVEETKRIIDAAREHKRFLMEGYWSRFFPAWQSLRSHLSEIGQIQFVQCNMCFNRKTDHDLSRPISTTDLNKTTDLPSMSHISSNAQLPGQTKDRILFSGGCYTVMFALWIFQQEMPEKITAVGQLDEEGNDLWGNVTLEFSGNRVANLFYSGIVNSLNSALVAGTNGCFKLPDRFWCSTELVEKFGSNPHLDNSQVHKFPIAKESKGLLTRMEMHTTWKQTMCMTALNKAD